MATEQMHQIYDQLSIPNQDIVSNMIMLLAERDGIKTTAATNALANLLDGVDLWTAALDLDGIKSGTVKSYKQKVLTLLAKYATPNSLQIDQFLTERIKNAGDDPKKREAAKATASNYIKAIRSFFNYVYGKGLWSTNPARNLKQPALKYNIKRPPTESEVQKLLAAIDDHNDLIFVMMLINTGMRVSELATIETQNVDKVRKEINILGKGDKPRTVNVSPIVWNHVVEYLKQNGNSLNRYLFPERRHDSKSFHLHTRTIERKLERYCDKAGIGRLTPHQLRHFFATYTLEHGADVKAVSEFLGHADVDITLKVYHHVNAKSIRTMHMNFAPLSDAHQLTTPEDHQLTEGNNIIIDPKDGNANG